MTSSNPFKRITLLEYMHAVHGVGWKPPRCFYCGDRATTLDHTKPRSRLGQNVYANLKPACKRCNHRKGRSTLDAFRKRLTLIWRAHTGKTLVITFYGEGAHGVGLRRLRMLLDTMTVRDGRPRTITEKPRVEPDTKEPRERARWRGRFTLEGFLALRRLAAATGCSFPVIERFILGADVRSTALGKLETACASLKLRVEALRVLKPKDARKGGRR